ncbi:glutathione s-transferase t3-like [Hordeum vulgare]|nr:glutathione s-transferase t3-like [Hordeum vulgare]
MDYHKHKEYVEPHPIVTTRNVASLQHRWGITQGEVNKYAGYYSQVTKQPQSGMGLATHTVMATTLYHEVEKKPFAFSHCWILLNGKPKWTQAVTNLKEGKKRNEGSRSHQSIGLEDEEDEVVVTNGRAIVPKDNLQVMENKWEKARITCDTAATKMPSTWTRIFSTRKIKKEDIAKGEDGLGSDKGKVEA